ncbi:MAG: ABC transporter permease [Actinomycetota bacterium]|nr:ABC transporter permease [Actinomycetota bacterium]
MKSSNWGFFLREAVKNMRLNMLMSFTAITTTAVCVTILGAALLVSAHIQGIIRNVGQDVTISAFFPENASQETIDGILSSVQGYSEVSESTYVSREEALERWKETFSDQPDIASGIGSDVLPASIELQLNDPRDSGAVAEKLRSEGFEEGDLNYPQRTIDNLNWYTGYMVWALRVATLLFLIASILLISNAIRLSIFARRKEIEVMKLVGASDTFVRTPFVLEGLVQGLLGASLAAVVVVWANSLFVDWAQSYLFSVSSESVNAFGLMLILIAVGVLIGVAGSYFSVRRFLKV